MLLVVVDMVRVLDHHGSFGDLRILLTIGSLSGSVKIDSVTPHTLNTCGLITLIEM